jgi:hypothetical protein
VTTRELIVELQKCPPDTPVYRQDYEDGEVEVTEAEFIQYTKSFVNPSQIPEVFVIR